MFKKIKEYFVLDAVVFTIMTVVLSAVYKIMDIDVSTSISYPDLIFQYFAVTSTMAVLFLLADIFLGSKSKLTNTILSICIVVGTVFIEGGYFFRWFTFNLLTIILVLAVIIVVYFSVYFIMFARNLEDSNEINEKLKKIQEEQDEENS